MCNLFVCLFAVVVVYFLPFLPATRSSYDHLRSTASSSSNTNRGSGRRGQLAGLPTGRASIATRASLTSAAKGAASATPARRGARSEQDPGFAVGHAQPAAETPVDARGNAGEMLAETRRLAAGEWTVEWGQVMSVTCVGGAGDGAGGHFR